MDSDFLKIKAKVDHLITEIGLTMGNYDRVEFENIKVYSRLEDFQVELESVSEYIKYMSLKPTVCHLEQQENGRYNCPEVDRQLTSGSRLEALVTVEADEEPTWCSGRVEFDNSGGYFFYNYDGPNIYLYEGMPVRIRK